MKCQTVEGQWGSTCTPESCNPHCALAVIDDILRSKTHGAICAEEVDILLDLRWVISKRHDAERAVILFCALRRSLEERFYLSLYRLRRWLENQIEAHVRVRRGELERVILLKIERFCPEAVRYHSLERARKPDEPLHCPKVSFFFRCPNRLESSPLPCPTTVEFC